MVRLTDEQAVKTAADRSEYQHPKPVKMKSKEKKRLKQISKRKRTESGTTNIVHKKMKDCRCLICLEDIDSKQTVTLNCNCVFHYKCIKTWFAHKRICPVCEVTIDLT